MPQASLAEEDIGPVSDIFISYATADRARIKPLVDALEQRGRTVWWDRTILAGKVWEREIEAALTESRCVIVAWSEASVRSEWVWTEADEGKRRGVLVPVLLDPVPIPLAFRKIQAANLTGWCGELQHPEFEELSRAVTSLIESGGSAELPPTRQKIGEIRGSSRSTRMLGVGRGTLALGGAGLACVIALGSYFALKPQGPLPGAVKANSKDNLLYRWIPPGRYMMGCSANSSECHDDERPAHEVTVSRGFWMGQTEVTQAAYTAVTRNANPSYFKGDDLPVEQVTWEDAKAYCEAVEMRLPTEAEWELAARAGGLAARYRPVNEIAWYQGDSGQTTHLVGKKTPNEWGLYDMLGNVWEWVDDWYDPDYYGRSDSKDPRGPKASPAGQRAVRGGSWSDPDKDVHVSVRNKLPPSARANRLVGFRCVGELP